MDPKIEVGHPLFPGVSKQTPKSSKCVHPRSTQNLIKWQMVQIVFNEVRNVVKLKFEYNLYAATWTVWNELQQSALS